ncbi:hypothetical protein ACFSKL_02295 [Belliella marina]|uniref:Uncharacterized protein n=1 Tax=Belliella marina TaxID=1644146 RepID=A0ABW4VHR4_9BACT
MNSRLEDIKALFYFMVRLFRSKLIIYVVISRNQLEMHNLKTGQTIKLRSEVPFSTNRLLIANNMVAENLGKQIMNKICGRDLKLSPVFMIIHPLEVGFDDVSPVEKMIYNDFGTILGAREVIIEESLEKLNKESLVRIKDKYS